MSRRRLAMALSLATLASACTPFRKINVYTGPQEMAIGEIFSTEVEALYPILQDPHIDWYLNHRGRQLADLSDRRDLPYTFAVVDSPELNAFAIPGGHIYINLGMLEACASENQLLALVAHEIGHVVGKHSMRQISQQSIISIVGTLALNQYPNQWAALAANLFGTTGFLKMSREDETAADTIGLDLMLRAGYDQQGMADVFAMLLRKYDEEPGMLDKLFATHPATRERIVHVRKELAAHPERTGLLTTTPVFQSMYDHMVKTYYTDTGRRRWRDIVTGKDDESKQEKDRLPWDKKSDEEYRKRKAKEREEKEKARQKRDDEEVRRSVSKPTPTPTPTPAAPAAVPVTEPAGASSTEPAAAPEPSPTPIDDLPTEAPAGVPTPLGADAGVDASESGRPRDDAKPGGDR